MPTVTAVRPQLVYLVFGADTYHQEAIFSIASAIAHLGAAGEMPLDIQVFTDNPQPYARLPVRVRPFSQDTRRAWSQPHGYHFRTKHVALREVLRDSPLAMLVDTDTFFRESPLALFARIQPGTLLCNAFSMQYRDGSDSPLYYELAEELKAQGMADDDMWLVNSGVIGLFQGDAQVLDRSIELMDRYYPRTPTAYNLEEFCLALATYKQYPVHQCSDLIHHYWSRKLLIRAKVQAWVSKHHEQPLAAQALADVRLVSSHVPRPPAVQRLAYKAVTLALPREQRQFMREILYGCYEHPNEFDRACAPVWWDKARQNLQERQHAPVQAEQLQRWLGSTVGRLILGKRRDAIYQHLIANPAN